MSNLVREEFKSNRGRLSAARSGASSGASSRLTTPPTPGKWDLPASTDEVLTGVAVIFATVPVEFQHNLAPILKSNDVDSVPDHELQSRNNCHSDRYCHWHCVTKYAHWRSL